MKRYLNLRIGAPARLAELRNNPCFARLRDEARATLDAIRKARTELAEMPE